MVTANNTPHPDARKRAPAELCVNRQSQLWRNHE